MHLWNKLIQTLVLNKDESSLRLAFHLVKDKSSILWWTWCFPDDTKTLGLPYLGTDYSLAIYSAADHWMSRQKMHDMYVESGYIQSRDRDGSHHYLSLLKKKLNV